MPEIKALRDEFGTDIVRTPLLHCAGLETFLGGETRVLGKCEFLQRTGTFKARGALATLKSLAPAVLESGVTAVSAGNHAIATAYAARVCGTTAKVVMPENAYDCRIEACRALGAEVILTSDVHAAFEAANRIGEQEGRYFLHPFEGPGIALGTGTVGLEIVEDADDVDAVLVAVGGGGLIGGLANAVKQLDAGVRLYGIEPTGADSMHRSLAAGQPTSIDAVMTIADSLGAPYAEPYSFELCRTNVDAWCRVDDPAIRSAMGVLFERQHIAVEPACAATLAALAGPLREELAGKTVVLVFCGSNIDWETFSRHALFDGPAPARTDAA